MFAACGSSSAGADMRHACSRASWDEADGAHYPARAMKRVRHQQRVRPAATSAHALGPARLAWPLERSWFLRLPASNFLSTKPQQRGKPVCRVHPSLCTVPVATLYISTFRAAGSCIYQLMPCSLLGEATLLQDPGVHHIAPTLYAVIPVKRWVEGAAVVASLRDNSHADNVCRIANVMPNGDDPIFIVSSDSGGYAFLLGNLPPGLVDGMELMFSITFLVNTGCSISFAGEMGASAYIDTDATPRRSDASLCVVVLLAWHK